MNTTQTERTHPITKGLGESRCLPSHKPNYQLDCPLVLGNRCEVPKKAIWPSIPSREAGLWDLPGENFHAPWNVKGELRTHEGISMSLSVCVCLFVSVYVFVYSVYRKRACARLCWCMYRMCLCKWCLPMQLNVKHISMKKKKKSANSNKTYQLP